MRPTTFLLLSLLVAAVPAAPVATVMPSIEAAAYYFPNYHPSDARNQRWMGAGWDEWRLMRAAQPRWPGHNQPKVPLWGYEDESDPRVMEKKIAAAADHGLTAFIFDWYWYEDGPYLERALEKGFFGAANADRLKFSLMWANHDWHDIHPAGRSTPRVTLAQGVVSSAAFLRATDHVIAQYFKRPNYWRVPGGCYFSFYDLSALMKSFGSLAATRAGLDDFRRRARAAGAGEIHLNAVVWGRTILPGEKKVENVNEVLDALGFDSVSSYVWVHHRPMPDFPFTDYAAYRDHNIADWAKFATAYGRPYFPNVTMGWDPSPRTIQTSNYDNLGYPFTPILGNNTPAEFKRAVEAVVAHLRERKADPAIFSINAWNEWTEGSYLEPDTKNGFGYLQAIRDVLQADRNRMAAAKSHPSEAHLAPSR